MPPPDLFLAPDGRLRAVWRFVLCVPVYFAARNLAVFPASLVSPGHPNLYQLAYFIWLAVLLVVGFSLMARHLDRSSQPGPAAFGLGLARPWLRDAVLGMVLGGAMVVAAVSIVGAVGDLSLNFKISSAIWRPLVAMTSMLLAAALSEELVFRGYPLQRLIEAVGAPAAVIVMSCGFGAAHGWNPHFGAIALVNTAGFGILLSLAYLRTGMLWLPWGMHFAWNAMLGMVLGLPVSGLTDFALLGHGVAEGPRWLTGGIYGIEGSATGTIVVAAGIMVMLFVPTRARADAATVSQVGPDHSGLPPGIL